MNRNPMTDEAEKDRQAIQRVEDLEDLKDSREAKEESKRKGTTTLADFKKELGL
jgi:hypothetical protein